ncbi:stage II sporulation protein E [Clostridium acetobutylicum]|uniref:Stage II sporulation protein E, serine phosphatase family n=1 Tax=Clostridium acetobutylicum (strain ATCC 824 / DSM 792 / JCM 1419 / IAM 19013 / LMG 5710 / NBRC 13948 / NRRL B-527 / VKM B-1787 / 2291 / W) TaxID=272562 RepID=Q97EA9_CLOAB|nr:MULTISPECIES: stage II sporulation protein E [Clostridium]AAK81141.1 Stage II sporulation protein E, serine phosphatase family [Clostridium acetobutylicum ATCC 824]ADZ22246.1 Stage II sporulation protein E, serine phosphatase family [Clostridium acetobutylicum EA 2018]AEI33912.1 stage II sporulation protein E [Clostridium acetobutylicum DSM 1731]AWV81190.1 stage II sporulation protein E [Clostridium acetobutylicum]MBC2396126.1 stage II sporulation protein E [Clostridium acetobutylicum]
MLYNSEVITYERAPKSEKDTKVENIKKLFILKVLIYAVSSFAISRVVMINSMVPFGIAFLACVLIYKKNDKASFLAAVGSLVGYISISGEVKDSVMYEIGVIIITLLMVVMKEKEDIKKLVTSAIFLLIEFIMFKILVEKLTVQSALIFTLIEIACVCSVYYIIRYGIICLDNIRTKHLFTNEEIISMSVLVALVISGTRNFDIYNVSIRNVLAMVFVIAISYIEGSSAGAAGGIAIGAIIGMNSSDVMIYIGVFGFLGFIAGVFKDFGKWITAGVYLIIFLIIIIYCKNHVDFSLMEAAITCIIFAGIPNKLYKKMECEFNWDRKQSDITNRYIEKMKDIFVKKLENFSEVLFTMSTTLNNLADNDKLTMKNKSCRLVENLADRVCGKCNMNSICWKREIYYTYAAFEELIQNFQEGINKIPDEIERKCVRRKELIKHTDMIINDYIMNEMWRMQVCSGREFMSAQVKNIGTSVENIIDEFSNELKFNVDVEEKIIRLLNKMGIPYKDIMCVNDKRNRNLVKLTMEACGGRQICVKHVLPVINEAVGTLMCVGDDGCSICPETNLCSVTFEETPKYYISSQIVRACKDGEEVNGDSYSFGKGKDGNYNIIISDGMGHGVQAEKESRAVIDLIEKFNESSLNRTMAINTVNSIMTLKFEEDEKFSTVDLCSVDLYSGDAEFIKVGGVTSFIKKKDKIEVINAKTLPIGVLDTVDMEVNHKKVENGDMIVMISDGVVNYDDENAGKVNWIIDFLKNSSANKPKELGEAMLKKAIELSGGKAKDDITIIISKVYSLY